MKLKITVLLSLISIGLACAQEKKWGLEECVNYAVENNLTIKQLELQYDNAKLGESDAKGAFLPTLNASGSGSWSSGSGIDPTTNSIISGTFFSMNGGVSSGVAVFNGLEIDIIFRKQS